LINHLAQQEQTFLLEEYAYREKISKNINSPGHGHGPSQKKEEDENLLLPLKERAIEVYINPRETGWEARYYRALFKSQRDLDRRGEISTNYLEGLEWTLKYYSTGCADWRWTYNYYYPPLLGDLIKYVPYFDHTFVPEQPERPVAPLVQLSYVLPPSSMDLLPAHLKETLLRKKPEWYVGNYLFHWSFCKFFWEAHVDLPQIDMKELEEIVREPIKDRF
jgi:5'-3' exonuclease